MQKTQKDYEKINKKLVELENTKIVEKMREWGIEKLVKSYEKETKDLREKLKDLEDKLKQK